MISTYLILSLFSFQQKGIIFALGKDSDRNTNVESPKSLLRKEMNKKGFNIKDNQFSSYELPSSHPTLIMPSLEYPTYEPFSEFPTYYSPYIPSYDAPTITTPLVAPVYSLTSKPSSPLPLSITASIAPTYLPLQISDRVECAAFSVSNTNNALQNTASCTFAACSGTTMRISYSSCSGDQYIRLYDSNNNLVELNDQCSDCGSYTDCSALTYSIPVSTTTVQCSIYTLVEGCYLDTACAGSFLMQILTMNPTLYPTLKPSSSLPSSARPITAATIYGGDGCQSGGLQYACSSGYYCYMFFTMLCYTCPANTYCPDGIYSYYCPSGQNSPAGSIACYSPSFTPTLSPSLKPSISDRVECAAFSVSNTNDAQQNTATCTFAACSGNIMRISYRSCSGDQYIRLYDSNNKFLKDNDDSNDGLNNICSALTYSIPANTTVQCSIYTLTQGCYRNTACSGSFLMQILTVNPTLRPTTLRPTTSKPSTSFPTSRVPTYSSSFRPSSAVPTSIMPSIITTMSPTSVPLQILDRVECTNYYGSNTSNAMQNTSSCTFAACSGNVMRISYSSCSGNQYIRLYDSNSNLVAENDDCNDGVKNICSALTYSIPVSTTAVQCSIYTLVEGCYGNTTCSGSFSIQFITMNPTLRPTNPTVIPTTSTPSLSAVPTSAMPYSVAPTSALCYTVPTTEYCSASTPAPLQISDSVECDTFSVSNTNNARQNTANCTFSACSGNEMRISSYSDLSDCSEDQYIRLYDSSNKLVAENDDCLDCGSLGSFTYCSAITYLIPTTVQCGVYTLAQGCYGDTACSGHFLMQFLTPGPTLSPITVSPTLTCPEFSSFVSGSCVCKRGYASSTRDRKPPCIKVISNPYVNKLSSLAQSALLTVFACYLVNPSYVGPTFQFRRSSDGNLTNFYADTVGNLGTGWNATGLSLSSWLSVNGRSYATAYVAIWYDQSGNRKNAFQHANNHQPRFDRRSLLVDFKKSTKFLIYMNMDPTSFSLGNSPYTISLKHGTMSACDYRYCNFFEVGDYSKKQILSLLYPSNGGSYLDWWYSTGDENDQFSNDVLFGTFSGSEQSISIMYDQELRYQFQNGAPLASTTRASRDRDTQDQSAYLGNSMNGELYHFFSFSSTLSSSDRTILEEFPPCATGSVYSHKNDSICRCDVNYYSNGTGLAPCSPCPVGSSTKSVGSTSCNCNAGYKSVGENGKIPCVQVTLNHYVNQLSSSAQSALLTVLACYLVNPSYFGPTFQFRRSSDGNLTNFYADTVGNLGTGWNATGLSLSSWLSNATAYVAIWYDQSGNGKNAIQPQSNQQPRFDRRLLLVDFKKSINSLVYMNMYPTSFSLGNKAYTVSLKHGTISPCVNNYCSIFHVGAYNNNEDLALSTSKSSKNYVEDWGGTDNQVVFGNSVVSGNSISITFDPNKDAIRYAYVNGEQVNSKGPFKGHSTQALNAQLGFYNSINVDNMNGELYFFYSFNIALSTYDRNVIDGLPFPSFQPTTSSPSFTPTLNPSFVPSTIVPTITTSIIPSIMPSNPTDLPSLKPSNLEISFGDGCKVCLSGSYCQGNKCFTCPSENFCPTGSYAYKCPPDLFAPSPGQSSCFGGDGCANGCVKGISCSKDSSKSICSSGNFCNIQVCYPCFPGTFCPNGLFSYPCPANFTSVTGSSKCDISIDSNTGIVGRYSSGFEIPFVELDALSSIYTSTNGYFWQVPQYQKTWDFSSGSSLQPCSTKWFGLNCSCGYSRSTTYSCNIVGITLNRIALSGKFPSQFGSFALLTSLDVGNNYLYGSIASELSLLSNLKFIDVSNNYLIGTLPKEYISNNLQYVYFNDNFFKGSIPSFATSLKLEVLNVSDNALNGAIPSFIGLRNLREIYCGFNNLSGLVPSFESNNKLQILSCSRNKLSGSIPSFDFLSNLTFVNLSDNHLIGTVPSNIGSKISTKVIYLGQSEDGNVLSGPISENYCTYQSLVRFSMPVSDTQSTCYPSCLVPLLNAEYLASAIRCPGVEDVAICGLIQSIGLTDSSVGSSSSERIYYDSPHPLVSSFYLSLDDPKINRYEIKLFNRCGIELRQTINICGVSNNNLTCSPLTCGNTSTITISNPDKVFVNYTKTSSNSNYDYGFTLSVTKFIKNSVLKCTSPPSFSKVSKSSFHLYAEQTTPTYASEICAWDKVKCFHGQVISLSLRGMGLKGYISESISLLTSLQFLDLSSNDLHGTIPKSIGLLKNLITLDLSANQFNGTVPLEILTLPALTHLTLSKNNLVGSISTNFSSSLQLVDFGVNLLHGQVPANLGSLESTEFNFQGNVGVTCFQPNPNGKQVNLASPLVPCTPTSVPTLQPTIFINTPSGGGSTVDVTLIGSIVGPVMFVMILIGVYFYRNKQQERNIKRTKKQRLNALPIHKALLNFYAKVSSNKIVQSNDSVSYHDNPLSPRRSSGVRQMISSGRNISDDIIKIIEENIRTVNEKDCDERTAVDICLQNYKSTNELTDEKFIYTILRVAIVSDLNDTEDLIVSDASIYGPNWIKVCSSSHKLVGVVDRILTTFPKIGRKLADTCDSVGRSVLQLAIPECTKVIIQSINLFKRYEINRQAHHKSATCSIHLGVDFEDGITGLSKVALKFMSNKNQFLSEIDARKVADFDQQFVVGIQNYFDSDNDEFIKKQLESFGFTEYPYVLVMIQCNRDLDEIISKELDNSDMDAIRGIVSKIAKCTSHVHEYGYIHGDLKPKNIMRMSDGNYVLIDLDACARILIDNAGAKISSAYLPPEMIYYDKEKEEYAIRISSDDYHCKFGEFVVATTAYDSWSLGIIIYFLCVGSSLFHCDRSENIINQSSLLELHDFTLSFKKEKLSKVTNPQAKNLISQLLNRDPTKRPKMQQVLNHPFITMKSTSRMVGEKAEFDVFLSYRVASDSAHVESLYQRLTAAGVKVWLDKYCLEFGKPWDEGFVDGLIKSRIFVPLFSRGAINHATVTRQNISLLTVSSPIDNFLLEQRLAIELVKRSFIQLVSPIMIGDCDATSSNYNNYFGGGCHPKTTDVVVEEIEKRVLSELDRQSLGLPVLDDCSVKSVIDIIFKNQGCFICGSLEESYEKIVTSITEAVKKLDRDDDIVSPKSFELTGDKNAPDSSSTLILDSKPADSIILNVVPDSKLFLSDSSSKVLIQPTTDDLSSIIHDSSTDSIEVSPDEIVNENIITKINKALERSKKNLSYFPTNPDSLPDNDSTTVTSNSAVNESIITRITETLEGFYRNDNNNSGSSELKKNETIPENSSSSSDSNNNINDQEWSQTCSIS